MLLQKKINLKKCVFLTALSCLISKMSKWHCIGVNLKNINTSKPRNENIILDWASFTSCYMINDHVVFFSANLHFFPSCTLQINKYLRSLLKYIEIKFYTYSFKFSSFLKMLTQLN